MPANNAVRMLRGGRNTGTLGRSVGAVRFKAFQVLTARLWGKRLRRSSVAEDRTAAKVLLAAILILLAAETVANTVWWGW